MIVIPTYKARVTLRRQNPRWMSWRNRHRIPAFLRAKPRLRSLFLMRLSWRTRAGWKRRRRAWIAGSAWKDRRLSRHALQHLLKVERARPTRCAPHEHDWDNDGVNPERCLRCGISFLNHIYTEMP